MTDGEAATVGGGISNEATAYYTTVAGGYNNEATMTEATVGGGSSNHANGGSATIAGGLNNTADGSYSAVGGGSSISTAADFAAIGGGSSNVATDAYSFIGGGEDNLAGDSTSDQNSAYYATVGGGFRNRATNRYATVPGGNNCTADGQFSFAAGKMAKALHDGAFVWGDNTTADINSTDENQFVARASGGVIFWSNSSATVGSILPANSGTWIAASSRDVKTDFRDVNGRDVLEAVAELPIQSWRYRGEEPSVRHIGPVSEDFQAAFGLGVTDKGIATVDADGVALAAIKALAEENRQLKDLVESLTQRLEALERR
jgi:hypothetical protein